MELLGKARGNHARWHGKLSPRQGEAVRYCADGKTDEEIGRIMTISKRTVGSHLHHAFIKLGVETRRAAANVCHDNDRAHSANGFSQL